MNLSSIGIDKWLYLQIIVRNLSMDMIDSASQIDRDKRLIESFPTPHDDFDRVDYSIKCNEEKNTFRAILLNSLSAIATPFLLITYSINRLRIYFQAKQHIDTIILDSSNRKGVEYSLEGRIPDVYFENPDARIFRTGAFPKLTEGVMGSKSFHMYLKFVLRHPLSFFNNLRVLVNLMGYNKLLVLHNPRTIVKSRMELNQISSLVTCFCEQNGCQFINLMHGESLYNIRTAFVRFSEFYIWDDYYRDVFGWSRSPQDQFITFKPGIYSLQLPSKDDYEYDFTFVLSGGDEECASLLSLVLAIESLINKGFKIKVRPHPRWSNIQAIKKTFVDINVKVENPKDESVEYSLSRTRYVVATCSTVLSEAYYAGKEIVLDDITNPVLYESLKSKGYILISKKHRLLSEFVCNTGRKK